ncbi:MAG: PIN domain-containing protein [Kiritimatiellae bacterium]|nr:PIN domain-containing protein [Kiritimatiellia bacterium]
MISCDTNVLFAAMDSQSPAHAAARAFLDRHAHDEAFCLSEQVLMEIYVLLRNPAVATPPLSARDTVDIIRQLRGNPSWRIVDVPGERSLMDTLWDHAAKPDFARRRIFDARLALTLRHHGVTEFATRNTRDFDDFGFERVWDPLGNTGD